ncbi:MAG: hypothetical protein GY787_09265 [Alteromonadales bacterium]|nr:hypothetical protein [Alteromonadales bacterium]
MKKILIVLIFIFLAGCNDSTKSDKSVAGVLPANNITVSVTVPDWLLQQDLELLVFDQTTDNELVAQTMLFVAEQETELVLQTGHIYKFTVNPVNNLIEVSCPLLDGCFMPNTDKKVSLGSLLQTRLSFSAIKNVTDNAPIELSLITDLAVKLVEGSYVEAVTPTTIKQVNSVLANTLGIISHQAINKAPAELTQWNRWLKEAINIAILFDNNTVILNGTSHLKTINRRLLHTLTDKGNRLEEFNQFVLTDAEQYLQQLALSGEVPDEQLYELAKLRAYVLSKAIYPNKGFLPSPYLNEDDLAVTKHFLDDYRSLLYTFADDSSEYNQLNNATTAGFDLINQVSENLFDDLFSIFSDVIEAVPLSAASGIYQVDELSVDYNKEDNQWHIDGNYNDLDLNLTITLGRFVVNAFTGNSYQFSLSGSLASDEISTTFTTAKISLFNNPPEDPFGGSADGTGHIRLTSELIIENADTSFAGQMLIQMNTHKNISKAGELVQHVEFTQVYGDLHQAQGTSQLALSLVHPDINNEVQTKILPDNLVTAVNYSGSVLGLGEPLLTMYLPFKKAKGGLDLENLDIIAYFEGRLSQFQFNGSSKKFTYQGHNQDGVEWSLTYIKKETQGQVNLLGKEQGKPRVLKDLAGIMFNDGNFISIF